MPTHDSRRSQRPAGERRGRSPQRAAGSDPTVVTKSYKRLKRDMPAFGTGRDDDLDLGPVETKAGAVAKPTKRRVQPEAAQPAGQVERPTKRRVQLQPAGSAEQQKNQKKRRVQPEAARPAGPEENLRRWQQILAKKMQDVQSAVELATSVDRKGLSKRLPSPAGQGGAWDFMISYTQRNSTSEALA